MTTSFGCRRLLAAAAIIVLSASGGGPLFAAGPGAPAQGRAVDLLYGAAAASDAGAVVPAAQPAEVPGPGGAAPAGVVDLLPDFSNTAAFVDSLFNGEVRDFDRYRGLVFSEGRDRFPLSPANESRILDIFAGFWTGNTDINCPKTDRLLLEFIRGYMARNNLVMFKPVIKFSDVSADGLPVYTLSGYKAYDVINSPEAAREFLELLLLGAHFVVVDGSQDSPGTDSFLRSFRNSPEVGGLTRANTGNSHYTGLVNLGSYNYLRIYADKAPAASPFICSFIAGKTADKDPDTFFQLEGWPSSLHIFKKGAGEAAEQKSWTSGLFGARHSRDFQTHKATLWNISTYGASAYSEKRGTAIFLAKPAWNPQLRPGTIMPRYRGADTPQKWLRPDLAVIDAPAPAGDKSLR